MDQYLPMAEFTTPKSATDHEHRLQD